MDRTVRASDIVHEIPTSYFDTLCPRKNNWLMSNRIPRICSCTKLSIYRVSQKSSAKFCSKDRAWNSGEKSSRTFSCPPLRWLATTYRSISRERRVGRKIAPNDFGSKYRVAPGTGIFVIDFSDTLYNQKSASSIFVFHAFLIRDSHSRADSSSSVIFHSRRRLRRDSLWTKREKNTSPAIYARIAMQLELETQDVRIVVYKNGEERFYTLRNFHTRQMSAANFR